MRCAPKRRAGTWLRFLSLSQADQVRLYKDDLLVHALPHALSVSRFSDVSMPSRLGDVSIPFERCAAFAGRAEAQVSCFRAAVSENATFVRAKSLVRGHV